MPLTAADIDRALRTPRTTYDNHVRCAVCDEEWMAHNGSICPLCTVCGKPGQLHRGSKYGLDIVEYHTYFGTSGYWAFCKGGCSEFVPLVDPGEYDNKRFA